MRLLLLWVLLWVFHTPPPGLEVPFQGSLCWLATPFSSLGPPVCCSPHPTLPGEVGPPCPPKASECMFTLPTLGSRGCSRHFLLLPLLSGHIDPCGPQTPGDTRWFSPGHLYTKMFTAGLSWVLSLQSHNLDVRVGGGLDSSRGHRSGHKPRRKVKEGKNHPSEQEKSQPCNAHTLNEDAWRLQRGQLRSEELISPCAWN